MSSVFETMLRLQTQPSTKAPAPGCDMVTAEIQLTGTARGTVLLRCAANQARDLTGQFLGTDAPTHVDSDVLDVMGELVNMVAGNLKCALLPGARLSIPLVSQGADCTNCPLHEGCIETVAFETPVGPVWIGMHIKGNP